jgi:hypothetical protein
MYLQVSPHPGLISYIEPTIYQTATPSGVVPFYQKKGMIFVIPDGKESAENYVFLNLSVPAPAGRQYGSNGFGMYGKAPAGVTP